MLDKNLIDGKLNDISGYLREIEPLLQRETPLILKNTVELHAIERLFQLIVDTTIDINTHIIAESGLIVPDDYQSTFITLGENKIIDMEFALRIAPAVGLRNLIVHRYEKVNLKKMMDDMKNEISDFVEYLAQIEKFVKKQQS